MRQSLFLFNHPARLVPKQSQWCRITFIFLFLSTFSFAALGQAQQWDQTFGFEYFSETQFATMVATPDGGYLLGGDTDLGVTDDKSQPSRGERDYWVVKTDSAGNKLWDKTFGGSGYEDLEAIVATADGGYLLGGTSHSNKSGDKSQDSKGITDYWLVKIDAQGNKLWDKTIGGSGNDGLAAIIATSDGGYLLGGSSGSGISGDKSEPNRGVLDVDDNQTTDYWVVKIDGSGNKLWDKTFGGDRDDVFTALIATPDGGYLLGGYSNSDKSGEKSQPSIGVCGNFCYEDYWVVKINASGTKVWDKTFGGSKQEVLRALIATPDGNYLLGGTSGSDISGDKSQNSRGNNDFWAIKIDQSGNKLWDKTLGGSNQDEIYTMLVNADGYLLGGLSRSNVSGDKTEASRGSHDYWVVQITANGTKLWDKTYGGSSETQMGSVVGGDYLRSIVATPDGDYLLGGSSDSPGGNEKSANKRGYWIIKIKEQSKKGQTIAFQILNQSLNDEPYTLMGTASSGLPITYTIVSGPATVDGNILTLTGVGTVTIKASQSGNATYLAAPEVTRSFIVDRPSPVTKFWDRTIGGNGDDTPTAVVATPDGGYLLGGHSASSVSGDKTQANKGESDFWVVKVTAAGTKIWDKTYNGTNSNSENIYGANSLLTTLKVAPGGGYILGGYTDATSGDDKTEASRGGTDYWVIRIDENGNKLWDKTLGGSGHDYLTDIIATADGNYLVGGLSASGSGGDKTEASQGGSDYWVIKISASGTKLWDKTLGGSADEISPNGWGLFVDFGVFLTTTSDGGFLLGGSSQSGVSGDKTEENRGKLDHSGRQTSDYWVVKLDASGRKVWDKTLGGSSTDNLAALAATPDGGYLLGGTSSSPISGDKSAPGKGISESAGNYYGSDYWVVKINSAGTKVWDKTFGGEKYTSSELIAMTATADGNYLLGGNSNSNIGNDKSEVKRNVDYYGNDFWLVKMDPAGRKIWDKTYGGVKDADNDAPESFTALFANPDGSYVATGFSYRNRGGDKSENSRSGSNDYWVIKFQEKTTPPVTATQNWRFGGSATDRFTVVIKTQDGGYLSGGYSNSGISGDKSQASKGGADYWIVKTDAEGKKQWDKTYGGPAHDYLNRIIQTTDGGYLLAGSSISGLGGDKTEASRGEQDYWLVKISADGTQQWDKTYGGSGFDDLRKVSQLTNGDYLLAGTINSPVSGDKSQASCGGQDYWVLRISSTGAKIWDQRYGGSANDNLESFTRTSDGGFLLAGSSASGKSGDKTQANKGLQDYWLVKINAQGEKLWDRSYGGTGNDELYSIGRTTTGDFFVAGHSTSGASGDKTQASQGGSDYWMLQLNNRGEKLRDKSFGGNQDETLRSIIQTPDGGYMLAGSSASNMSGDKTQASQGGTDYWVVKTDANGNKQYDQRFGGSGAEELRYMERTADGGYLLGGRSDSGASGNRKQPSQGSTDYWLVKFIPTTDSAATALVSAAPQLVTSQHWQTYPNPFTEKIKVAFTPVKNQLITVKVYDGQGQEVAKLYQGRVQAGQAYNFEWQPRAQQPKGVYIIKLQSADQVQHQRAVFTR